MTIKPDKLSITEQDRQRVQEYPSNPHIMAVARQVYPTWLTAHGHKSDRGVESLASDIGHAVACIQVEGAPDFVLGGGFVVIRGPGIDGWSVCVVAGEVFALHLEMRLS